MHSDVPAMKAGIIKAFAKLRKHDDFVARVTFMCCGSCATSGLLDKAEKQGRTRLAYYHGQDEDYLKKTGEVYIGFGTIREGTDEAVKTGKLLQNALEEAGLKTEWDGNPLKRILVSLPK